jgi:hypothetical protein
MVAAFLASTARVIRITTEILKCRPSYATVLHLLDMRQGWATCWQSGQGVPAIAFSARVVLKAERAAGALELGNAERCQDSVD